MEGWKHSQLCVMEMCIDVMVNPFATHVQIAVPYPGAFPVEWVSRPPT